MWSPDPEKIITAAQKAEQAASGIKERFRVAVQAHVDEFAKARRYDNGVSLASYVASGNAEWAAEAQAFVAWRDAVWLFVYAQLDLALAGGREIPTVEGFIDELPAIEWLETEGEDE